MAKKILFSAKLEHDVIKKVVPLLKSELKDFHLVLHDPTKDFLDLEKAFDLFGNVDFFIVKVGSECSLDLLHFAKLHKIPALHDIDIVLMCKNKVSLDHALRKVFSNHSKDIKEFLLPKSWTHSLMDLEIFKKWASYHMPLVIKSHYQHDKYMRFTFLVNKIENIDKFCKMYSNFLYYNVYIQEFIESDGMDRKIYVVGDDIFGIMRENPIYIYLKNNVDSINVDEIERETFEVSESMKTLAQIISRELHLKIFGFDLIKPIDEEKYYLVDLNDFPGLRGIKNIEKILSDYIRNLIKKS
jgi:glutathione synthase/RimK-type ligase-like ATP-grasp enzyme